MTKKFKATVTADQARIVVRALRKHKEFLVSLLDEPHVALGDEFLSSVSATVNSVDTLINTFKRIEK